MPAPQPPIVAPFKGTLSDTFASAVAPAASVDLLVSIAQHVAHGWSAPYAVCGLSCDPDIATVGNWHFAQRINVGALALRAAFFAGLDSGTEAEPPAISAFSSSSGATAADEITVSHEAAGALVYPPGIIAVWPLGGETIETAPSAAMDRPFELYGTAVPSGTPDLSLPYCEGFDVGAGAHGMGGRVTVVADLGALW